MRSFFNVILVVSACAAALSLHPAITRAGEPQSVSSTPVFPYSVQKTTLDNGLTVMSVPFDSPGIIAYYTIVRTGSRNEVEKGLSGFAHFFEHMMFRGTEAYSGRRNTTTSSSRWGRIRTHLPPRTGPATT